MSHLQVDYFFLVRQNIQFAKTVQKYRWCCFRAGKSTVLQTQSMRQILRGEGEDGGVWSQFIHISVDFKATDVTINRQKLLRIIKHFQISQYLYGLGGATVRHAQWSVKMWDSLKEPSEMAVLGSV